MFHELFQLKIPIKMRVPSQDKDVTCYHNIHFKYSQCQCAKKFVCLLHGQFIKIQLRVTVCSGRSSLPTDNMRKQEDCVAKKKNQNEKNASLGAQHSLQTRGIKYNQQVCTTSASLFLLVDWNRIKLCTMCASLYRCLSFNHAWSRAFGARAKLVLRARCVEIWPLGRRRGEVRWGGGDREEGGGGVRRQRWRRRLRLRWFTLEAKVNSSCCFKSLGKPRLPSELDPGFLIGMRARASREICCSQMPPSSPPVATNHTATRQDRLPNHSIRLSSYLRLLMALTSAIFCLLTLDYNRDWNKNAKVQRFSPLPSSAHLQSPQRPRHVARRRPWGKARFSPACRLRPACRRRRRADLIGRRTRLRLRRGGGETNDRFAPPLTFPPLIGWIIAACSATANVERSNNQDFWN